MILSKDKIYKTLFYIYFILLPFIAAAESFNSGSNKIFNAIFLVLLAIAVFDLHRRSLLNKYIVVFFAFSMSIFLASSIVYGLDLTTEYQPSIDEGMKVGFRVLMLAFMTYFAFLLTKFEVLQSKDLIYISIFLVLSMLIGQLTGVNSLSTVRGAGSQLALQGIVGHVAITSSILLSVLPILLVNSHKSIFNFFVLVLCSLAIIFTFRRSAWLILCVLGVIHLYAMYFANNTNTYRQLKIMGLLISAIIAIVFILSQNQAFYDAMMTRLQDLNLAEGGTGAGRSVFWGILWNYVVNQPLVNFFIGNGYGFIQGLLENRFGSAIGAHNDWLDYFLAFGIVPLVLFVTMVLALISNVFHSNRNNRQLLGYCLFCVLALSITTGGAFDTYFAFLHASVGFVLASQSNDEEELKNG